MPSSSMMQQRPTNMLDPMKHELHVQDEQDLLNVVHGVMHGGFQVISEKYWFSYIYKEKENKFGQV